jgi:hypothetical protein
MAGKKGGISRRDLLSVSARVIPAALILPKWIAANAQTGSAFDFYISPTGSDSNPGTQAQPWSITAINTQRAVYNGKTVGLMNGTYNVSSLMQSGGYSAALQIDGGSAAAPTVIAAVNPRQAIITALSPSAVYGGVAGYKGPIMGHPAGMPHQGYVTIDGVVFKGASYRAVQMGTYEVGPTLPGIIIQNCEFTANSNVGNSVDNVTSIELMNLTGALVHNNYIHDNTGTTVGSADHLNGILMWESVGTTIEYNTVVNSGNIYGKEIKNQGSTVRYNYVDASMFSTQSTANGIQDFTGSPTSGLTMATSIHHNIVLSTGFGLQLYGTLSNSNGWSTPCSVYNNTVVMVQASNGPPPYVESAAYAYSQVSKMLSVYNNIWTGVPSVDYKMLALNPNGLALWDFNLFRASQMTWRLLNANGTQRTDYTSLPLVAAAVAAAGGPAGFDAHGVAADSAQFTASGQLAAAYQLQNQSPAKGTGTTTGLPGGSSCDMGAWGNGATQIGCNFATGSTAVPDPPSSLQVR